MTTPTVRESLEILAKMTERGQVNGAFIAGALRTLAARCAPQPAEPAPAPAPLAEALAPLRDLADTWEACAVTTTLNANACGRYVREAVKRLADRLAESVPGGAEEERTAAYAEGWHDGRKALLDHEGIALSGAAASGAGATRESERAALVAEVGECCQGGDPLCYGGCLVQHALLRRAQVAAPPATAPSAELEKARQEEEARRWLPPDAPSAPPARGNAPRSDEEAPGGSGDRTEGGSGRSGAPTAFCGEPHRPALGALPLPSVACRLEPGHRGPHQSGVLLWP